MDHSNEAQGKPLFTLEDLLKRYQEFDAFIRDINLENLVKDKSRQELDAFSKQIDSIRIRNIGFELSKITESMKKVEYPQLLGVHHYPALRDIQFMPESKKIELDKFLLMFRVGQYLTNLYRFASNADRAKQLENFLIEQGIVEKNFLIKCPHCMSGILTKMMNPKELDEVLQEIEQAQDESGFEELMDMGKLEAFCGECEDHVDLMVLKNPERRVVAQHLKLIKERDGSLDHV